jgi:outer membrane receptor protein involved in Fe transport
MAASKVTTFTMGRLNSDLHTPGGHTTSIGYHRQQERWLVSLNGDLSSFLDKANWSAYYQRGTSQVRYNYFNMAIPSYFSNAADVVRNPAVGGVPGVAVGAPVCRSTLTNPTNGCVPADIFGVGTISEDATAYITGVSKGYSPAQQNINILQEVAAGQAQAEPFSTWAGPVSVAAGVERRHEKYTSVVDQASKLGLWFGGGFTPSAGGFTVLEAFGETIVPLLRDVTLVKSLDINAAVRRTDYSTSGVVVTWKVGGTWDVNDEVRLRGTESRDIRAPNMLELFNGGVATVAQTRDRTQPNSPLVNTRQITGGNPNLKPEIAKTYTWGGVYRPDWGGGLSASVDYYKISIKDAITTVTGQQIVDQCFGVGVPLNPAACANIVRDAANPTNLNNATIYTGGLNAQQQTVEGLDYEISYRWQLNNVFNYFDGNIDLRLLASQRLTSETILAGALTNALGTTTDGPRWRGLFTVGYTQGPSRTNITVRYLGPGVLNNFPAGNPQSVDYDHYKSATYVELAENWDFPVFGADVTVYGVIQNLFDKAPPPVPSAGATSIGADSLHDLLGRAYRAGFRYKF